MIKEALKILEDFRYRMAHYRCKDCKRFKSNVGNEGLCHGPVVFKTAADYPICKNFIEKDEE